MIKLNNVDKYFNKGKSNEIHVINNTSLEFPKTGLVSLLGESGSGKTTLLNVIGGLDKAHGTIEFKGNKLSIYNAKAWDNIRVNHIGYIFQNYYLLEDKTVSENIHIVLQMMGINDLEEIKYRTEYVLNAVNMFRFRNKLASDLSGGQKQRVAIARAIVKNPDVIIADEPTGNLDTNNSIEVLKIIKEISKEKLVILVTHNISLAENYSDRIINIKDGSVLSDKENLSGTGSLKYIDNNIYLKDLESVENNNVKVYSNSDINQLDVKLIKINNNYYLQTSEKNITINIINEKSNVKIIDAKKEEVKKDFEDKTSFSLEGLEKNQVERSKKSVYTFKDSVIQAMKKLLTLGKKGKLQLIALIYLGFMFTSAFLLLMSSISIDMKNVNFDDNVYRRDVYSDSSVLSLPEDTLFSYDYLNSRLINGSYSQLISNFNSKVLPKELVGLENTNKYDVYIDETVLDKNYSDNISFASFGITKKEHFVGQKILINDQELTIRGTVNTGTKNIYMDSQLLYEISVRNWFGGKIESREFEISNKGLNNQTNDGVARVYISDKLDEENINQTVQYLKERYNIDVAGFYIDNDISNSKVTLITKEEFTRYMEHPNGYKGSSMLFYIKDKSLADSNLVNVRDQIIKDMKEQVLIVRASSLVQTGIAIGLTILIFYFLVRSTLTSRRKEISILRSLGISKNEVRRLFISEYAIMTTFTSLIGVLLGSFVASQISKSFLSEFFNMRVSPLSMILAIILIYVINIFISLIPVNMMLKKTPSELLTNYDI